MRNMKKSLARKSSKRANGRVRYDDDPSRILELELEVGRGKVFLSRSARFDPRPHPKNFPKQKLPSPRVLSLSIYLLSSKSPVEGGSFLPLFPSPPPPQGFKTNPFGKKNPLPALFDFLPEFGFEKEWS